MRQIVPLGVDGGDNLFLRENTLNRLFRGPPGSFAYDPLTRLEWGSKQAKKNWVTVSDNHPVRLIPVL